jgi:hypothetical protein
MLERLGPDPARDDFDDLYQSAKYEHVVQYLAAICPPRDLTSILQLHVLLIAPSPFHHGGSTSALEAILKCGVCWQETDSEKLARLRRCLMKISDYDFRTVMRLLGKPAISDPGTFEELTRTKPIKERMLALQVIKPQVSEAEKRRAAQESLSCRYDREKLYQQVWSEPVQHVAVSYGVSGVRIGKVCRILNIPTPARGYWARLRSGQKMRRPPLSKLK